MTNTKSAGGIIINSNHEIVLVNQYGTSWSFPKGHVEAGEDDLAAAKREIFEETGLTKLELISNLGSYERPRIDKPEEIKIIHMFLFKTSETILISNEKDITEVIWANKKDVIKLLTADKDKEFFLKHMNLI